MEYWFNKFNIGCNGNGEYCLDDFEKSRESKFFEEFYGVRFEYV